MSESIADRIIQLFHKRGDSAYLGEAVSQTEHALQSAWAAEQAGASAQLITAALLHDVGHLLATLPEDRTERGLDDRHEELGYRFLLKYFGPDVAEPVRMHVAAKRYLCAIDPEYLTNLSPTSVQSLQIQGGIYSPDEANSFAASKHSQSAITVRRWDDLAKTPNLQTPALEHFRMTLIAALG